MPSPGWAVPWLGKSDMPIIVTSEIPAWWTEDFVICHSQGLHPCWAPDGIRQQKVTSMEVTLSFWPTRLWPPSSQAISGSCKQGCSTTRWGMSISCLEPNRWVMEGQGSTCPCIGTTGSSQECTVHPPSMPLPQALALLQPVPSSFRSALQ